MDRSENMSLLTQILQSDESPLAKQSAYLIYIIKELGWDSLTDPRIIKPNLRRAQVYLRKKAADLTKLFSEENIPFTTIERNTIVDAINPLLIRIWHIQIIGTTAAASLELLQKIKPD